MKADTAFINKKETNVDNQSTEMLNKVDFRHPEFCTGCDPVACIVEGNNFSSGNWRDILV